MVGHRWTECPKEVHKLDKYNVALFLSAEEKGMIRNHPSDDRTFDVGSLDDASARSHLNGLFADRASAQTVHFPRDEQIASRWVTPFQLNADRTL